MTAGAPEPEPNQGPGHWLRLAATPKRALVVIVVVLALLEGGIRIIEGHLPRVTSGDQVEVTLKYEQLRVMDRDGAPVDVLFMGNSTMDAGLDPATFARASARFDAPYNAALLGQPTPAATRWADQFVLPLTRARTVVIGLTPLDVRNANVFGVTRASTQAAFDGTFDELKPTALQRLDHDASAHLAIVRNRSVFHSPVELWRAAKDTATGKQKVFEGIGPTTLVDGRTAPRSEQVWRDHILQPRGGDANYWYGTFDGIPGTVLGPTQQTIFRRNTIDTGEVQRLVDTIRDHGISDIVLVVMPHDLDGVRRAGVDLGSFRRGVAAIEALGRSSRLPVIDFSEAGWPRQDYFDYAHLNRAGSTRFSTELAKALDGR